MAHNVGLDGSVLHTSIFIVVDGAKIVRETRVSSDPEAIIPRPRCSGSIHSF